MRGGCSSPAFKFDTYDGDLADQLLLLIWMLKSPQINGDVPSMFRIPSMYGIRIIMIHLHLFDLPDL